MLGFERALKSVTGFACEELQHERFQDRRPVIMACILQVDVDRSTGLV